MDRIAVVTGAARGIGRGIALALARRGFGLALSDRLADALAGTVGEAEALGVDAMPLVGDVSDHAWVQRAAAEALGRFGRIDVLVNNAGISQPKGLLEITEAEWDLTLATNLKSQFSWCKAIAPAMLAQGRGRIINISSVSANTGAGFSAVSRFAYCASKAGVLGLTRGLAKELAPSVTVNAICPGAIETELTRQMLADNAEAVIRSVPLARFGTPEDIGEVAAFLATVSPSFMTGEVIDVDGGQWVN